MRTILHISADFPDPLEPGKTKAVASLVDATEDFRHVVYSLNRVSWRRGVSSLEFAEDRVALAYGALPYGIGLTHYLQRVAETIGEDLTLHGIMPDVIHAHKFSVEGVVAATLAKQLGCPFVASLWGDTDIKIFEAKRALRSRYRDIARQAALLLPAAPWTADYFADALQIGRNRFEVLPVMTTADSIVAPKIINAPRCLTVLALDSWRRKGLDSLARAVAACARTIPNLEVDVYGRGSPRVLIDVQRVIREAGAEQNLRLAGPAAHGTMQWTMNRYAAFLLPTRRETYGMVHAEAILAGVPALWSRDRGIDGLYEGLDVGYRCDPSSVEDIAAGIASLLAREAELKQNISRLQVNGALDHLRRPAIAARYRSLIRQVIGDSSLSRPPRRMADNSRYESLSS